MAGVKRAANWAAGEGPRVGDRVKVLFADKKYYEGEVLTPGVVKGEWHVHFDDDDNGDIPQEDIIVIKSTSKNAPGPPPKQARKSEGGSAGQGGAAKSGLGKGGGKGAGVKTGAGQAAPGKADNKAGKKEERSVEEEEEEDGTQPAGGEAPRVGDRVKVLFTDKRYYEGKIVAPGAIKGEWHIHFDDDDTGDIHQGFIIVIKSASQNAPEPAPKHSRARKSEGGSACQGGAAKSGVSKGGGEGARGGSG
ncbi:hypothetical protein T484DRAFT_1917976, partial [Baffinella frigidus]